MDRRKASPTKQQKQKHAAKAPRPKRDSNAPLTYVEADEAGPAAVVSWRAGERLRAGHLWVYRSEVDALVPALGHEEIAPGTLVTVLDSRRIPLGTALFSSTSEITLRAVSAEPRVSRGEYLDDVRSRVQRALALREPMLRGSSFQGTDGTTDSLRLLFAEADGLPGILADRYNDLLVLQLLTQGTAQDDVREVLRDELATAGVRAIVERPDPRIRQLEALGAPPEAPLLGDGAHLTTSFHLNGLQFHYDANAGQKTGAFLDQRLNYAAAAKHAHGRGLDVCTYQGGFALHLAKACTSVIAVDQSRPALEVAEQNYNANSVAHKLCPMEFVEADAFELLRHYDADGERFDTIVLDPPAFAKSKRAVEGALRGYKELNLRALRMLNAGGTLVTCSCSHHIALPDFVAAVSSAAADAKRHVRLLEMRAAAPDHPEVLTLPETRYLKCLVLIVD